MSYFQTYVGFGVPAGAASAMIHIGPRYPADIGLLIQHTDYSAGGSQTGDLMRVLNSGGTTIFKIDSDGMTTITSATIATLVATNVTASDIDLGGVDYTWPSADASADNMHLTSNGAGALTWEKVNMANIQSGKIIPVDGQEIEEDKGMAASADDGYAGGLILDGAYNDPASGGLGLTRHNYIDIQNLDVYAGRGASVNFAGDACVLRFDAGAGTHYAVAASAVGGSVDAPDSVVGHGGGPVDGSQVSIIGWGKVNLNGTVGYIPIYGT